MAKPSASKAPVARRDGVVSQSVGPDGDVILFDPTTNQAHHLDALAVAVWEACDGVQGVEEIGRAVGLDAVLARDTVVRLSEIGLVSVHDLDTPGAAQTRRTLLRGAAAAGLLAVPIIATVDVPAAAAANSVGFTPTTLTIIGSPFNGSAGTATYQVAPDGAKTTLPYSSNDLYVALDTGAVTSSPPSGGYVGFACVSSGGQYTVSIENQTGGTITYGYVDPDIGTESGQTLGNNSTAGVPYTSGESGSVTVNL